MISKRLRKKQKLDHRKKYWMPEQQTYEKYLKTWFLNAVTQNAECNSITTIPTFIIIMNNAVMNDEEIKSTEWVIFINKFSNYFIKKSIITLVLSYFAKPWIFEICHDSILSKLLFQHCLKVISLIRPWSNKHLVFQPEIETSDVW